MRSLIRSALAAAVLAAPIAAAAAQAPNSGSVLHISPYAGVMVFGSYLNGPLNTTLTNKPGMLYGTQVGLSLAPQLSLVGNIGYTSSSIDVGLPIIGGVSVGSSSTLIYDADLEYELGSMKNGGSSISPFVQAGVGAMRYDINAVEVLNTTATNFAGNVGIGADFAMGKGMAIRLLAKDYIGKFNFQDAVGVNVDGSTAHNFGLTAGMRFDF
ncbi:MAG TPA: outer membrane beta-barrel protein [Casimicrobiaceae bacterium]|jgi:hypothetical protein